MPQTAAMEQYRANAKREFAAISGMRATAAELVQVVVEYL